MNNRKLRKWLMIGLSIMLVFSLMMAGCQNFPENPDSSEPSTSTPSVDTPDEEVILYYNLDGAQYAGKGSDGQTSRPKDADSGYYIIQFAAKGRVSQRRVLDRRIATKVDNQMIMALVFNEDGIVSGIQTVDECTGGYYMTGKTMYVSAVDGNTLTLYGNSDMKGTSYQLKLNDKTKIYDVSDAAKAENAQGGAVETIAEKSQIVAVLNKDGSVGWVYVTKRPKTVQAADTIKYCEHCGKETGWIQWESSSTLPTTSGHYYLSEDVKLFEQTKVATDEQIVLDLNGYTVTGATGKRIYALWKDCSVNLSILDTSAEKTGRLIVSGNSDNQGMGVWMSSGEHTLNIYGGTLDASGAGGTIGLAVCADAKSTLNMYGGKIIGGGTGGKNGAAIYLKNATFNMKGGIIEGGKGKSGGSVYAGEGTTFNMEGGTITGGEATNGGNVYVSQNAVFKMTGGTIEGGSAISADGKTNGNGGNVYVDKGTMEMTGGTIANGTGRNGGNIFVNGIFKMTGGSINGGKVTGNGSNVYNNGTVTLGGTAKIAATDSGKSSLYIPSGKKITVEPMQKGAEIYLTATGVFAEKTEEKNAQYFHSDDKNLAVSFSNGALSMVQKALTPEEAYRTQCICGASAYGGAHIGNCDGTKYPFAAWTSDNSLPTTPGYYCLTKDVILTNQMTLKNDGVLVLDLNGHTVTAAQGKRIYVFGGTPTLTITDSSKNQTGMLDAGKASGMDGMAIYTSVKSTINLYGGTIIGGTDESKNGGVLYLKNAVFNMYGGKIIGGTAKLGGSIYVGTETVFNMFGGTIEGGRAISADGKTNGNGGNIYVDKGTVNMSGGTITGGTGRNGGNIFLGGNMTMTGGKITGGVATSNGGNIYVLSSSTLTVDGGTIEGGLQSGSNAQNGGNVYVAGTLELKGNGIITGGTASNGGNIYLAEKATLNMLGGTLENGVANNSADYNSGSNGGNIYVDKGTVNMSGGTIAGGTGRNGGNIFLNGKMTATGGKVTGGVATGNGGNVYVLSGATLTVDGGIIEGGLQEGSNAKSGGNVYVAGTLELKGNGIITGGTATNGGNIYLAEKAVFNMLGGTVEKGVANNSANYNSGSNGGNIYVDKGTVNMSSGTITGGTGRNGGNVFLSGKMTVTGGTVTAGVATSNGGNVYVLSGATLTVDGGTIEGGLQEGNNAQNGGNVYIDKGGVFLLQSGTVQNGSASAQGGNIYIRGKLEMSGGTVTGGTATSSGQNIQMTGVKNTNSEFVMSGGQVDGYVYISSYEAQPIFKISGNASIIGNHENEKSGVTLAVAANQTAPKIEILDGFKGQIYVEVKAGCENFATAETDSYADYITVADGYFAFYENGGYTLYSSNDYRAQCICGASLTEGKNHIGNCDGKQYLFTAWKDGNKLPSAAGYYYLATDVNVTGQTKLEFDGTLVLDLNGHTVTATGTRVYATWTDTDTDYNVTLSVTDSSANGAGTIKYSYNPEKPAQAGIFWLRKNDTLNIYGGKFDASGSTCTGGTVVYCEAATNVVNMYGGTLIGGTATGNGATVNVGKTSIFNMYGGTITGGTAVGNGGSVYVAGTFHMKGDGVIKNGTAALGGNVYVTKDGTLEMSNGTISDGVANKTSNYDGGSNGGNIYLEGAMTMTGGAITGGTGRNGGNIFINGSNGKLTMQGGRISGGTARAYSSGSGGKGGNVCVNGTMIMESLTLADGTTTVGTVEGGAATDNGYNICVLSKKTLTINAGNVNTTEVNSVVRE